MLEPSLPLHLQAVWGYKTNQVGLVYLATFVPALICKPRNPWYIVSSQRVAASPLSGYIVDKRGPSYLTCICLFLALPWWIIMTLRSSLLLFIVALAAQSMFVS